MILADTFDCDYSAERSPVLAYPTVVIENSGSAALAITADAFVAIDAAGTTIEEPFLEWLVPSATPLDQVTLQPGEVAIGRLSNTVINPVSFIDPADNLILLYERLGCQGGGALPIKVHVD